MWCPSLRFTGLDWRLAIHARSLPRIIRTRRDSPVSISRYPTQSQTPDKRNSSQ
jgi:hypothetical protein